MIFFDEFHRGVAVVQSLEDLETKSEEQAFLLDVIQGLMDKEWGSVMKTAKLFKNGQSQAVRLPKEFRMMGTEVYIKKQGEAIVLLPKEKSWATLFKSLDHFEKDFKIERNQPVEAQKRGPLFQ